MSIQQQMDIVVAGHICVDIIVELDSNATSVDALFVPGKLLEVGPSVVSGGGAVFNTGVALHRLGAGVRLIGNAGKDLYGQSIVQLLQQENEHLPGNLVIKPEYSSSYTLVISSPQIDRVFLHHPGANDLFKSDDVADEVLSGAGIFHFGYPPLMKQMYNDDGENLAMLFRRVRDHGLIVSLDMAKPDPESAAGQVDWRKWMINVLPGVDLFMPSIDEILYMLNRPQYDRIVRKAGVENLVSEIDGELLGELSGELLSMGAAIVVIKLGEEGLYMRTTDDTNRLMKIDSANHSFTGWGNLEILKPCFQTLVAGTTGSGDCAIAGFLIAFSRQATPVDSITNAAAVGAISVEQVASISAVPGQESVSKRIEDNWQLKKTNINLPGWVWDEKYAVWRGPCNA